MSKVFVFPLYRCGKQGSGCLTWQLKSGKGETKTWVVCLQGQSIESAFLIRFQASWARRRGCGREDGSQAWNPLPDRRKSLIASVWEAEAGSHPQNQTSVTRTINGGTVLYPQSNSVSSASCWLFQFLLPLVHLFQLHWTLSLSFKPAKLFSVSGICIYCSSPGSSHARWLLDIQVLA